METVWRGSFLQVIGEAYLKISNAWLVPVTFLTALEVPLLFDKAFFLSSFS